MVSYKLRTCKVKVNLDSGVRIIPAVECSWFHR